MLFQFVWNLFMAPEPTLDPKLKLFYCNENSTIRNALRILSKHTQLELDFTFHTDEEMQENFADHASFYPILVVDDAETVVSYSILRYIGKLTKTYPQKDKLNAALTDKWLDMFIHFSNNNDNENNTIFDILNTELEDEKWLGGFEQPTIADFCWTSILSDLQNLDNEIFDNHEFVKLYVNQLTTDEI